jgi:transposase
LAWKSGKPYAQDLRDRVFMAADEGVPVRQIAEQLSVSISYVSKVLRRRRLSGERNRHPGLHCFRRSQPGLHTPLSITLRGARPQCCHVPLKLAAYHTAIQEQVKARPDATLAELQAWLLETHKVSASIKLMWETLGQLCLTLKKRPCRGGTEPNGRCPGSY